MENSSLELHDGSALLFVIWLLIKALLFDTFLN